MEEFGIFFVNVHIPDTSWVGTARAHLQTNNLLFFPCRFVSPEEKIFAGPNTHSALYNAMIHPFLNMTIYGAIWYQGEANADAPCTYNCTFPAMIDDWRSKWFYGTDKLTDPEFPFGFVQVDNYT